MRCVIHWLGGRRGWEHADAVMVLNGYAICADEQCAAAATAGDTYHDVLTAARAIED